MDSYQAVLYILHQFSGAQVVKAICKLIGKDKVLQIITEEVE
jgi:hypothetical protein